MRKRRYKVTYVCRGCDNVSTTQKKKTRSAPAKCVVCGSTKTRRLRVDRA